MTAAPASTSHDATAVPRAVRLSVVIWLAAIAMGAAEALVWLLLPGPPTPTELAVRFAIYTALVVLVLSLHTGRNAVRWTVAVLLGGVGTLSLVVEPVDWLLAGGSPAAFLATADGPSLVITALRTLHIAAVAVALTLLFRPSATRYFRRR
ncbi:hypothetical protein [Pseudonocardia alaniniphila]|uniref:DUF4149 domain-containing protein n=1 Tax=Pseudonocardia alaniniphila TaxID=75291 RepID=A0ABS9TFI3_9PSEU|nr:hypothetical protein [Pseudonocardia alaniniphila]MCH6167294.1 hypothetical protein [Pseudonocardia alaniniphila]